MKNRSLLLAYITTFSLLGVCFSYSQVVIQHSGANDPLTEGFWIATSGPATHDSVFNDQGLDAWKIHDIGSSGHTLYLSDLSPEDEAAATTHGWVLSATMRFVEPGISRLEFMTGNIGFSLWFILDSSGDITLSRGQVPLYTLEGGGTDYHEYSLVYDPIDDRAAFWMDGEVRLTDILAQNSPGFGSVLFGSGGPGSHTHWNDVSFTIIPEPATVPLLTGLGTLLLVGGMRWRRRKGCQKC